MYIETSADGIEFFVQEEDADHSRVVMSVPEFSLSDLIFTQDFFDMQSKRDFKDSDYEEWEDFIGNICEQFPRLKEIIKNTIKEYEEQYGNKECWY